MDSPFKPYNKKEIRMNEDILSKYLIGYKKKIILRQSKFPIATTDKITEQKKGKV